MKPTVHCPVLGRIRCLPYLCMLVLAGGLLTIGVVGAGQTEKGETLVLQGHLDRLIEEEASLRREVKEGVQLATRPYAGYLLHQKSLHLVEKMDRLRQLKQEKMEVIQGLARMGDRFGPGIGTFQRDEESRRIALSSTYSGAPSLSFNNAIQVDSGDLPRISQAWIHFFRFIFLGYVLLIFVLPLIAIQKRRADLSHEREKGHFRVFPILTVQRPDGHCELLSLPVMGSH